MKAPSSILALASVGVCVQGHGYISQPKASYEPNTIYTTYNALTSASINKGFDGGHYNWSPTQNAQAFTDHWNATGYKSLREMLDPIAPDYGHSLKTATPVDVSGYTEMWWQNDEYKEGFIASHEGPCEAWIDDTRIFHYDNCAAQFKTYPAKVPADYSSCKGDCLFVFYWLALHEPDWQIYKQCVPITNNGKGTSTTQSSGENETPETEAPSTTQKGSSSDTGASDETQKETASSSDVTQSDASVANEASQTEEAPATPAPEAATEAPEATTAAPEVTPSTPTATEPATNSGKCGVRRRL
ncbi:hypothetical protein DVH05_022521 [Phytophthora capsici]|nr:hypothetical protein DVH05_022521 [Phytophthora capsici]|eukprot:jgi/Phyca11/14560/fgenesh1_pg.PHYCAscaffold_8_\